MKKAIIYVLSISILISLYGCTYTPHDNSVKSIKQESSSTLSSSSTPSSTIPSSSSTNKDSKNLNATSDDASNPVLTLNELSRSQSGLDSIPLLDFSKFTFNNRISDILTDSNIYKDEDYKNGLVKESDTDSILISERFSENIISGIKIGTDIGLLKSILGNPSFSFNNFLFYKTSQYYLGFKGKEMVEQAIIRNNPLKYRPQILEVILNELNRKDYSDLQSSINSNSEIANFFESNGHIEGGGWYANSYNGITIQEFPDDNNVTVYNNFEGDLYNYGNQKSNYKIVIKNEDYIVDLLSQEIDSYITINNKFDSEGTLSPSGKLKSIYDWVYALSQYFTIRTLDNSKPDFQIPATSKEYKWINDDYILYIHAFYNIPYIVKVYNSCDDPNNVFYKLGITKEEYPSSIDYDLKIQDVSKDSIILEDNRTKKTYTIKYNFSKDGLINLSINKYTQ